MMLLVAGWLFMRQPGEGQDLVAFQAGKPTASPPPSDRRGVVGAQSPFAVPVRKEVALRGQEALDPYKKEDINKIKADPFPKLETFQKVVGRYRKTPKNPKDFDRKLEFSLRENPSYRTRLIESTYPKIINLGEGLTRKIRSEIKVHADGNFVFQNQKIYRSLEESGLDPNLPICILHVEYSNDSTSKADNNLTVHVSKIEHPVTSTRNFLGVRIKDNISFNHDIQPRYLDCGFISDLAPKDDYKMLEYMHLYATVTFGFWDDK